MIVGSLLTRHPRSSTSRPALFVDLFTPAGHRSGELDPRLRHSATICSSSPDACSATTRRIALFSEEAKAARTPWATLEPSPSFIGRLERELAGSIGAASAHVMLSKVVSGDAVSLEEVMQMADETQQAIEYSQELERTSDELRATADKLEDANRQLREVDQQKDEFLSQVSHEVRTPMTSIRAFSEILLTETDLRQCIAGKIRLHHPPGKPAPDQSAR